MQGFELPGHGVILIEGRDAGAFLHAQLAGDLRTMTDGARQWNCYLTPQGRVTSVFVLARESAERFVAHVPEGMAGALVERLERYVLRSKVTLGAPAVEPNGDDARSRLNCIRRGIPVLAAAVSDQFTAHALSLDRLQAFSTSKGCYPGQEIVARTHFKGRSKRALTRLAGDGAAPAPGARLDAIEIVCAAAVGGGFEALAVAHEEGTIPATLRRLEFEPLDSA